MQRREKRPMSHSVTGPYNDRAGAAETKRFCFRRDWTPVGNRTGTRGGGSSRGLGGRCPGVFPACSSLGCPRAPTASPPGSCRPHSLLNAFFKFCFSAPAWAQRSPCHQNAREPLWLCGTASLHSDSAAHTQDTSFAFQL